MENNKKLRIWWIPQVGSETMYIPVESPEEGRKLLDILAVYDLFQLENNIKPDFCNCGGLQQFDEEYNEWNDWWYETEDEYFDDLDEYCESNLCKDKDKLEEFTKEIFKQLKNN